MWFNRSKILGKIDEMDDAMCDNTDERPYDTFIAEPCDTRCFHKQHGCALAEEDPRKCVYQDAEEETADVLNSPEEMESLREAKESTEEDLTVEEAAKLVAVGHELIYFAGSRSGATMVIMGLSGLVADKMLRHSVGLGPDHLTLDELNKFLNSATDTLVLGDD